MSNAATHSASGSVSHPVLNISVYIMTSVIGTSTHVCGPISSTCKSRVVGLIVPSNVTIGVSASHRFDRIAKYACRRHSAQLELRRANSCSRPRNLSISIEVNLLSLLISMLCTLRKMPESSRMSDSALSMTQKRNWNPWITFETFVPSVQMPCMRMPVSLHLPSRS